MPTPPSLLARAGRASHLAMRMLVHQPRLLGLTIRVTAWILWLSVFGRLFPLPIMLRQTDTKRRWPESKRLDPTELEALVDRVFRSEILFQKSCWKRAAVLRRYLLLNGIETDVVFGVRKEIRDGLDGHAWLERDGTPYLEREEPQYVVTFRHPTP